jgi:hypothetical protein
MTSTQSDYCRRALRPCFPRVARTFCTVFLCGIARLNAVPPGPSVTVVDIIPVSLSGETSTNSEPNLAVNPANPSQIAASAYLPEPMGGRMSSILISTDGGTTWSCRSTVPIDKISCDVTLRFGGLNMLYVTALNENYDFLICRSSQLANQRMDDSPLRQLRSGIDQPYIAAAAINGQDRVFVGANDWYGPPGRNPTVVRSLDGRGNSPSSQYTRVTIEFATPPPDWDDPEIRPAISGDGGRVYAVFNRMISKNGDTRVGDVILVRDDNGGNSGPGQFTALNDQNGVPGFPVIKARTFLFDALLGIDRLGGDLAIAVDPRNADSVYLVWGELLQNQPALHVIRSTDGGKQWSGNLRTVRNAKNPGLAVSNTGTLAFLYQQVATEGGQETWFTQVELTKDDFQSVNPPLTLSKFPVAELASISGGQPRLGDYLHLMAVGDVFYGIFSASNVPDLSRFPSGVTFQRHNNSATKKLRDQRDRKDVDPSVDPFFFKITGG